MLKCRALGPDGKYVELELESRDGGLCRFSNVLGLDLRLEDEDLGFFAPELGEYLPSLWEQQQIIGKQRRDLEEQRHVIEGQDRLIEGKDRALEAAMARIRELERQRRP